MDDAISLGVGAPDFDTPWHIREEGIYSLERGKTHYTSNSGLKELRTEKNPYKNGDYVYDVNKSNMWEFNHRRKIMYYNTLLSISSNPSRNYDVLLEQSKIQDYFSELFRKNYGLEEDSSFDSAIVENNSIVLTKKYPGASVSETVRYL